MGATLQQTLQFDASDLAANRKGYITSAQRERLMQTEPRRRSVLMIGGILFGCAVLAAVTITDIGLPLGLLLALVGLGTIFSTQMDARELPAEELRVEKVVGVVQPMTTGEQNHIIRVGRYSFRVTEEQVAAFVPNQSYILYYLPHKYILLSAEPAATFRDATSETQPLRARVVGF